MDINLAIAERARAGEPLTAAELDELSATDLLSLGMLADEVRRARVGETVTFTRVCEVTAAKEAGGANGAEVRITGAAGTLADTVALVRECRAAAGASMVTGFSLADLANARPAGGARYGTCWPTSRRRA